MSKQENFSPEDLLSKYGSFPNLTKNDKVPVEFSLSQLYRPSGTPPSPNASPLSCDHIARKVEEGVRVEAQRRGTELVTNPLHPDNRTPRRIHDQNPIDPLE